MIAQQDDFIVSFSYLRMIEGTRKDCFADESLLTKILAPPSMRAENLPVGEVWDTMEICSNDSSSGSNIYIELSF